MWYRPVCKAVGDDGIPNEFLKEGGEVVIARTQDVLLEKGGGGGGGGGDREDLNNHRGITLSCVGKLHGKILGNKLGGDAEASGVHSDLQFAFREGRSAM